MVKSSPFSPDDGRRLQAMHDRCVWYRGRVVHGFSIMENMMNMCIIEFYAPFDSSEEKYMDMSLLVMHKKPILTFQDKQEIMSFIIKSYFPEYVRDSTNEKSKTLVTRIKDLQEFRNVLAHWQLFVTNPPLFDGDSIVLHMLSTPKGKKDQSTKLINEVIVRNYETEVIAVHNILKNLYSAIKKRVNK